MVASLHDKSKLDRAYSRPSFHESVGFLMIRILKKVKRRAQEGVYGVLKRPAAERVLHQVVARSSFSLPLQSTLARFAPQPYCYDPGEIREVERHGARFRLRPAQHFQWYQLYGLFDEVLDSLVRFAGESAVIFDIGANVGFYSVVMAKAAPSARIESFEPHPDTFDTLRDHCRLNNLSNVTCHCFALGSEACSKLLHDYGGGDSGKFSLRGSGNRNDGLRVEVRTLDDFVNENAFDRLDLVKIDVEGLEPEVFSGGRQTIERFRPRLLFELTPAWYGDPASVGAGLGWLHEMGYTFFQLQGGQSIPFDWALHFERAHELPLYQQFNLVGLMPVHSD